MHLFWGPKGRAEHVESLVALKLLGDVGGLGVLDGKALEGLLQVLLKDRVLSEGRVHTLRLQELLHQAQLLLPLLPLNLAQVLLFLLERFEPDVLVCPCLLVYL